MAVAGERKEASMKQSDIPPNFVTLVQLQERWLKKKAEEEEEEERKLKELQDEAERRRKFEETKRQQKSEAILRNSESSSHRREIRRVPVSAQALGEGKEDDEGSKRDQGRKSKKQKKRKKIARVREKKEEAMQGTQPVVSVAEKTVSESTPFRRPLVGKEVRIEYRPKIKISKGDEIENEYVPSRMGRSGKRAVNLDEENCKLEIEEAKLAELSVEESKCGLETKDGVGGDGLYQTRRRSEVNRARHVSSQTTYDDGKRRNGDGELSRSECQDPSNEPLERSCGRSRGRGDGGRGSRVRGGRGRGSRGRYNKVGVWVRREDVGSHGEVTVNGSGVQLT